MSLVWDGSFSVGIEAMDRQHRRILALIADLRTWETAKPDVRDIEDALYALTRYVQEHFQQEEALLAQHQYPGLASQVEEHRAFAREVAARCMKVMEPKPLPNPDLLPFLEEWWRHHVLVVDMGYKPFFEKLGIR